MEEAKLSGFDDMITTTERGIVLEAAFGNLFWVDGKTFYTPNRELPLHFGVTITHLIACVKQLGYRIEETETSFSQLPKKACYYRVNTLAEICPIASIEGQKVQLDASLTAQLRTLYRQKKTALKAPL